MEMSDESVPDKSKKISSIDWGMRISAVVCIFYLLFLIIQPLKEKQVCVDAVAEDYCRSIHSRLIKVDSALNRIECVGGDMELHTFMLPEKVVEACGK